MLKTTCLLLALGTVSYGALAGAADVPAALSGVVSSDAEGMMEGVLVKAKRVGSIVTVTVVSDEKGRFAFPADRLKPGHYDIDIRAVGYDLANSPSVDIASGKSAHLNLKLGEAGELADQLSNTEWLMSFPGTVDQHDSVFECVICHSLTRIAKSTFDGKGWVDWLTHMQTLGRDSTKPRERFWGQAISTNPGFMDYLSTINLNKGPWKYELKTLPRPKGRATHVIITEYDAPARTQPHEVVVTPDGTPWFTDHVGPNFFKLDLKTEKYTAFAVPDTKPGAQGMNFLEADTDGNLWVSGLQQAAFYKLDTKTGKFTTWKSLTADKPQGNSPYPPMVGSIALTNDEKIWYEATGPLPVFRLDLKTGQTTTYDPFPGAKRPTQDELKEIVATNYATARKAGFSAMYGNATDSTGNLYTADIGASNISVIDAKTGIAKLYPTPTPYSGPRRMKVDKNDRLWFTEYYVGKIGMFDPKTKQFQEWAIPGTPYAAPYDLGVDKKGDVWAGGMQTDLVYRLIPATGEVVQYLLPSLNVNIRGMGGIENRPNSVVVWIGENLTTKIAKVEPLD